MKIDTIGAAANEAAATKDLDIHVSKDHNRRQDSSDKTESCTTKAKKSPLGTQTLIICSTVRMH